MEKFRKSLALLFVLVMVFTIIPVGTAKVSAATTAMHTQAEAVSWLESQDGASYDFGNFTDSEGNVWGGTQCVEFVRAYVNWLVNDDPWADAWGGPTYDGSNIWENPIWERLGWDVYENPADFLPQPGDIFSSGKYHYGGSNAHTGVVISSDLNSAVVADSNARNSNPYDGDPVYVHTINWKSSSTDSAYGATHYIRPKFSSNYNSNPTTGQPVQDILNVALAKVGKTQSQLGYSTAWCAYFVGDCAKEAGLSNVIPYEGVVGNLYSNIITNYGASVVSTPQAGDLVFYKCTKTGGWCHVALMVNSREAVNGNLWENSVSYCKKIDYSYYLDSQYELDSNNNWIPETGKCYTVTFVRPNYHTHSYGAWQTVTAATCTADGSQKRVCSCGDTQTATIPALGHAWNAGEIVANAGCTDAGVKKYTCTRTQCSETKTEAISATGHNPVTDSAVPATCTETGLTEGSHCSACGAIIVEQQVIPALGHNYQIQSMERGCETVTVVYQCDRCGTESSQTSADYLYSAWSETRPADVDDSLIEEKTQYSYRDKSTTYQDGSSSLTDWTYTGTSEPIYGDWTNAGWTKNQPTESDTLHITDTKTVTDQEAYTVYNYYHYYGYADNGVLYNSYGNGYWKNYEDTSSTSAFPEEKIYGEYYQAYKQSVSGKHGVLWWLSSTDYIPAVTHDEWYYQTCTKTIRYYFEKWSDWSDFSDTVYETNENREVQTRTVYRYKITPAGHTWQTDWAHDDVMHWHTCTVCGLHTDILNHTYDNNQDATCNTCGYTREVRPMDENSPKIAMESKKVLTGKEFTLSVDLSKNPGLAYLRLALDYDDSALELISATNAGLLGGTYTTSKKTDIKPYIILWMGAENSTGNGNIVTLTFKAKDDAVAGEYPVSVDVVEAYNDDFEDVAIAVQNAVIKIQDVMIGDLNGDEVINGKDGILCAQALAGWDVAYSDVAADVNGDGVFNGKDGILLAQYLAGWDVVLG